MNNDFTFKIIDKSKNFEIIPEHKSIDQQIYVYPHDQIKDAGNYTMMSGEDTITGISCNYNRKESELKFYSISEIENQIKEKGLKKFNVLDLKNKPISKVLDELNQGIRFWKLFVILSLIFLIAEVLLLRFIKS